MKEVAKKQLPEVSGGVPSVGDQTKIPAPPAGIDYPRNPFGPVIEAPFNVQA